MSTTLNIKDEVASQLGKNNGSVDDVKRDTAIKRARRKFYSEFPFSFLKTKTTITFASGEAAFPADMNKKFEPKIYQYSGLMKKELEQVEIEDVAAYSMDYVVFAIDKPNRKFYSNIDGTFNITYIKEVPYSVADNNYEEPCDDISAITNLSIAFYWLSSERNDDMYKQFYNDYTIDLARIIRDDRLNEPVRRFKDDPVDYGYGA